MKVLITGSTGFIGARVLLNLLERGIPAIAADANLNTEWVRLLARFRDNESGGNRLQDSVEKTEFICLDISDDASVQRLFEANPDITHVIHLAYLFNTDIIADQRRAAAVNIMGTVHLLEAAADLGVRRMVFAGSETVYGPSQDTYGDHPVREDEYCAPQDHAYLYGMMKLLNERTAHEYLKAQRLDVACIRPPVVFGDGRDRGAVLWAGQFASNPAIGTFVQLPFSRSSKESWIYVDDCAEQFVSLTLKPEKLSHLSYNSGGFCHTAEEMMTMVEEWIPGAQYAFDENIPRTSLVDDTDGSRLEAEIDFKPRPVREALKRHIEEARFRAGLAQSDEDQAGV
jgi:UDP-glucose 4-epimerase